MAAVRPDSNPLNARWAIHHFLQAVQQDSKNAETYYALARVAESVSRASCDPEDIDLAHRSYTAAITLSPHRMTFACSFGVFLCGQGRYVAAKHAFERAVALESEGSKADRALAHANLGQLLEHHMRLSLV